MDFTKIKKRALTLTTAVKKAGQDAIEYSAGKLADSKKTLKSVSDLEALQKMSANSTNNTSSGEMKTFTHRSGVIFIDVKSDFFSSMLLSFAVLQAKAYSQNMSIKLMDIRTIGLDMKKYKVSQTPAFVIFENEKVFKVIQGQENIQKVVKAPSLDINKVIQTL